MHHLSLEGDGARGTWFKPMNPEAVQAGERGAAMIGGAREPHHVHQLLICVARVNSEGLSIGFVKVVGEVSQVHYALGPHGCIIIRTFVPTSHLAIFWCARTVVGHTLYCKAYLVQKI